MRRYRAALLTGLQGVWLKIDKELMKELIRSMNMRVKCSYRGGGMVHSFLERQILGMIRPLL